MKVTVFTVLLLSFVVSFSAQTVMARSSSSIPLAAQNSDKINLNNADVRTLTKSCKGIGKKRAEAIVKYREMHGGFRSIEELADVRGIGKQFVKRHKTQLKRVFSVG